MATAKDPSSNTSTHSGREKLHRAYNLAGEAAHDTAAHMRTRTRESVEKGKQRAHDVAERAETSIKAHPLVSVGCAFAAGWLIAKIFR